MTLVDAGTLASAAFFCIKIVRFKYMEAQVHFSAAALSPAPPMHGFGLAAPLILIIVTTFPTS